MRNNKWMLIILLIIGVAVLLFGHKKKNQSNGETIKEVKPIIGQIESVISTTGTVLPKNRLQVKPPVNGRIESMLVQEGEKVKAGQILAWMSSTERAALLDAARGKNEETLKYWQEMYKPIPLVSPMDADVIVATTQMAETVTVADAIVVLSDHLIVRAQVDETDIGKISLGQVATISLDAYPKDQINATVEHIYYESQTVNNVTIYPVDLLPQRVPSFFRSGMNATVNFIEQGKENALLIPTDAVTRTPEGSVVMLKSALGKEPIERQVKLGMSDDKNYEVLSGLSSDDTLLMKSKKYTLPKSTTGSNPFMPPRPKR